MSSSAALGYHTNKAVCGVYGETVTEAMKILMSIYDQYNPPQAPAAAAGGATPPDNGTVNTTMRYFSSEQEALSSISPTARTNLQKEMLAAEQNYTKRAADAMTIADQAERDDKLAKLKASFQSKQSLIRKKYGIRLRGRRTRAVMEAEQMRLSQKAQNNSSRDPAAATIQISSSDEDGMDQSGLNVSPSMRPDDSIKAQSGLSGSAATAETQDPTAIMDVEQPQGQHGQQGQQGHGQGQQQVQAQEKLQGQLQGQEQRHEHQTDVAKDDAMAIDSDGTEA